jgi:hypothetical protein
LIFLKRQHQATQRLPPPPSLHCNEDEGKRRGLHSREVTMYLLERATLTSLSLQVQSGPLCYASTVYRGVLVLSLSLSDEDGDGDGSSSWGWV